MASSLFKLRAWQSFCTTSLHVLFGLPLRLDPPLHIPYISSPNQCLLFTTHAHTIATCFAVVSILYHLLSFLTGQASLPFSILLCTQLLYNLPVVINYVSLLVSNGTYLLPEFIPSNSDSGLHSCITICIQTV